MTAAERSPAFQFYFKDWRSSKKVQRMSFKERGMYLEMMIDQWDTGPLPKDPKAIAELIGAKPQEFLRSWPLLSQCFIETEDGFVNARLEAERQKQQSRKQRVSDAGRNGADKRWTPHRTKDSHPIPAGMAVPSQPDSFSLSIASASAIAGASASDAQRQKSLEPEEIQTRAGRLVERYGELFQQHRFGARYHSRPNLDWHEALGLVQTWEDPRLERLMVLVLTTDDPWISKTDRSFKVFAMKATWADERLSAWEAQHGVKTS